MSEHTRVHRSVSHRLAMLGVAVGAVALMGVVPDTAATPDGPPLAWVASSRNARKQNPIEADAASIARGKKVYAQQCLACHGRMGTGDGKRAAELSPPPGDLSSPKLWLQSDGELFWKIAAGRTPMPAFKKLFSTDEHWHVVNYVRTLAPKPKVISPRFTVSASQRSAVRDVLTAYLGLHRAMAENDSEASGAAGEAVAAAAAALAAVDRSDLDKAIARLWKSKVGRVNSQSGKLNEAIGSDPAAAGEAFDGLTRALADMLRAFGGVGGSPVHLFAIGQGDDATRHWLQKESEPRQPYGPGMNGGKPDLIATFGSISTPEEQNQGAQ